MTEMLTHADIRDLLKGVGAAIELDQLRVDAVPAANFQPSYDDKMWRAWRADHIGFINDLLPSVDAIPLPILTKLTGIAIRHAPTAVGNIALELFAEAVSGSCPREDLGTAEIFFGRLIKEMANHSATKVSKSARSSILEWLSVTDPLRIAQDPEAGYGRPSGCIS